MKKTLISALLTLIAFFPSISKSLSQTPCQVGYHVMSTQAQVDSFPSLFPNCPEFYGTIQIYGDNIENLDSLYILDSLIGALEILDTDLTDLSGLNSLVHSDAIFLWNNPKLVSLDGLNNLSSFETLRIWYNAQLSDISAIDRPLDSIKAIWIEGNPELNYCAILPFCEYYVTKCIFGDACAISIEENGDGCESLEAFIVNCGIDEVQINLETFKANVSDCSNSILSIIHPGVGVNIQYGIYSFTVPLTHIKQFPLFNYQYEPVKIIPKLFAKNNWELCQDTININPAQFGDTLYADILLRPLIDCPELKVDLGLPPNFRGCLVTSDMQVRTQNTGTVPAKNVQLAVVLPFDLMEVESVSPLPISQNGDTLFFALGGLDIFEVTDVNLTVRARCDTFLLDHTICIEAFASMDNPCPPSPPVGSLIQTTASCLGNDIVRFTLTNIGDEPTSTPHQYFIIEDVVVLMTQEFDLDVLESMFVDVDATGSTFRMEATKLPDGPLTATALEGCGGFTPGLINAFWLDEGYSHYDIGCRQVSLAYDPNDKMAIPSGVGPEHLLAANRPIEYTIRFQNTGTDTAYRVLLTDILPPELDVNSFRPGFASHDYTWEIRGLDTLEVLFFPIALPDSAASQEGSQGFFTFSMDQQPDLPSGSMIQNTASIIFDFNPPIITNTVFHTIGQLTVSIDHPQLQAGLWKLQGNPMANQAIFRSTVDIPGAKRFELYDLMGHAVRQEVFHGDEYLFTRGMLRGGMYIFRLIDGEGRQFTGKIILAE
jgi:uncharacterized repeat protein (TIGR01451 family)